MKEEEKKNHLLPLELLVEELGEPDLLLVEARGLPPQPVHQPLQSRPLELLEDALPGDPRPHGVQPVVGGPPQDRGGSGHLGGWWWWCWWWTTGGGGGGPLVVVVVGHWWWWLHLLCQGGEECRAVGEVEGRPPAAGVHHVWGEELLEDQQPRRVPLFLSVVFMRLVYEVSMKSNLRKP